MRKKIAEFRKENKELELSILKGKLGELSTELYWYEMKYEHFKNVQCFEVMMYAGAKVKELNTEVNRISRRINILEGSPQASDKGGITDKMIDQARNYPFEELHPFKRNMALCPFHDDRNPSMSLKNNRVRCWACMDKSMDTIEFVMKKDGLSFRDAVRKLR